MRQNKGPAVGGPQQWKRAAGTDWSAAYAPDSYFIHPGYILSHCPQCLVGRKLVGSSLHCWHLGRTRMKTRHGEGSSGSMVCTVLNTNLSQGQKSYPRRTFQIEFG